MRSGKGSRKIVVNGIEFRWRATGDDGYITVGIWPTVAAGPYVRGNFRYHEGWIDTGNGVRESVGNQIVVTNRIIRRIIEYAVTCCGYDPSARGKELNLKNLDGVIQWNDAVRASRRPS